MKLKLAILVSLASTPALSAPFEIDPLASYAFARQQVELQVASPSFYELATFPAADADKGCADMGWTFAFTTAGQHGQLSLWLAQQGDECAWRAKTDVTAGTLDGVGALDEAITRGALAPVDDAVQAARAATTVPFTVVAMTLKGGAAPTYMLSVEACGAMAFSQVDAVNLKVIASTVPAACPAQR